MSLQLHDLLARGYFPLELPPPFGTTELADVLAGPRGSAPPAIASDPPHYAMLCTHNLVRGGGLRRLLGIPNPVQFYRLAEHICSNWPSLEACARRSPFSLTHPMVDQPERAITPEHPLAERTLRRAELRAHGRFLLRADIARFFPSIYTHALPWAVLGKAAAKASHAAGTLHGSWEDRLDVLTRNANSQQTVGIPIGPDTSRLLAEVLLGRVDEELAARPQPPRGVRYIDDYEFVTETHAEAESILSELQAILSQYELALNQAKTEIISLPTELEARWTSRLRTFIFRQAGATGQRNDLIAYFDEVFDFVRRHPDDGVLKYGVARLQGVDIDPSNWRFYEDLLNQAIRVDPACIPQVCSQITHYGELAFEMRRDLWSATLNRVVVERLPLGQASEAAWAMWLMKILAVRLTRLAALAVGACSDSIAALMALGLASCGLSQQSDLAGLQHYLAPQHLNEDKWLLCYQANLMGWLGAPPGTHLLGDPRFAFLASQRVSFFDVGTAAPIPNWTAPSAWSGGGGGGDY